MVLLSTFPTLAQESVKPAVLRRVYSEKVRDAKLEAAILAVVETGNGEDGEARYYYNRVDLDGDKKPEVLVYVFGRLIAEQAVAARFCFGRSKINTNL
jgi:hypothetical protein